MDEGQVVRALAALAQETRLRIFRILVERGPEGCAAGVIGDALGVPSPTLSFHLQQLANAGLVAKRRESRSLIYTVDIGNMNGLMGFLTEKCCSGHPEICVPAAGAAPIDAARAASQAREARKTTVA